MPSSSPSSRRKVAKQSFQTAAECIGTLEPGSSLFAVTRGQFSMIDAILACLDQTGPAAVSLWTWTIAEYEIQSLERLQIDNRLLSATLIIDYGAREKNRKLLESWQQIFGETSIRLVINHAKIATIKNDQWKMLLRGSMNLNYNPRFEQFDLTEGGDDFDLVKEIESELEILPLSTDGRSVYNNTGLSKAFSTQQLSLFGGTKVWAK